MYVNFMMNNISFNIDNEITKVYNFSINQTKERGNKYGKRKGKT